MTNMKSHFLLIYIYVNLPKTILCSQRMNQASTIAFTHDNTYGIESPKNILLAPHTYSTVQSSRVKKDLARSIDRSILKILMTMTMMIH